MIFAAEKHYVAARNVSEIFSQEDNAVRFRAAVLVPAVYDDDLHLDQARQALAGRVAALEQDACHPGEDAAAAGEGDAAVAETHVDGTARTAAGSHRATLAALDEFTLR